MRIYADILVLVNIYIDYFVLVSVARFLHIKIKNLRLAIGCILGGLSGLISVLPINFPLMWGGLVFSGILICFATFFSGNIPLYIKSIFCFFTFSLIFSGIILVLVELFGINASVINGTVYFGISPILLIVFTTISYVIALLFEEIKGRKEPKISYCRIILEGNGEKVELFSKIDTGNSLKEPFSGLPVIVVELSAVEKVLPLEIADYIKGKTAEKLRLVPFNSIGGGGLLPAFKPKSIYFKNGKTINCYLAVYHKGNLSGDNYSALVNPEICENY